MNKYIAPLPANEQARVTELAGFDLDYSDLDASLTDLTLLAAKVAGTDISHVSLVDSVTNWAIASHGFAGGPSPREDSVCQYTITQDRPFEVLDMQVDERFRNRDYVTGDPHFRYYLGVPLQTESGNNLGALCVLHKAKKELSPEKIELLRIIANEIITRLLSIKEIKNLQDKVKETNESQRKVAHDIRGPLGGIIGLTQIISEQGYENSMEDVLEFVGLIRKSSDSLLELAEEILSASGLAGLDPTHKEVNYTLETLREKLEQLYAPQAMNKEINFSVQIKSGRTAEQFSKLRILQIAGNLISNALKFTPKNGTVKVELELLPGKGQHILVIHVIDNGVGMDASAIGKIMDGNGGSTDGTVGERGFGFGLPLVKSLVEEMKGELKIASEQGKGAHFEVRLKLDRVY